MNFWLAASGLEISMLMAFGPFFDIVIESFTDDFGCKQLDKLDKSRSHNVLKPKFNKQWVMFHRLPKNWVCGKQVTDFNPNLFRLLMELFI